MEAVFSPGTLGPAAHSLASIINVQSPLPILQNVMVEAREDGRVTLFASDLEAYARLELDADVKAPGRLTLPGRMLAEMARDLPEAPATLRHDGTMARLDCDEVHYQLASMPADDFPDWPEFAPTTTIEMAQADFRLALEKVLVAVPSKDPRKVLLGAFFQLREDDLRLVGTDGKKLITVHLKNYEVEGAAIRSAVIPAKVLGEVERQLAEAGTVRIRLGDRQVAFETGRMLTVSNVIEGEYPHVDMVIPKDFAREVSVPREALLLDVRRASVVQDKAESRVILNFEKDRLKVSSYATDLGTFESTIPISHAHEPMRVCFNHQFLTEILKVCGGSDVLFRMNKPATPVVMKNEADASSLYLLMPIKLTDYHPAPPRAAAPASRDEDDGEEPDSYDEDAP